MDSAENVHAFVRCHAQTQKKTDSSSHRIPRRSSDVLEVVSARNTGRLPPSPSAGALPLWGGPGPKAHDDRRQRSARPAPAPAWMRLGCPGRPARVACLRRQIPAVRAAGRDMAMRRRSPKNPGSAPGAEPHLPRWVCTPGTGTGGAPALPGTGTAGPGTGTADAAALPGTGTAGAAILPGTGTADAAALPGTGTAGAAILPGTGTGGAAAVFQCRPSRQRRRSPARDASARRGAASGPSHNAT
jgi:hypothetical protein